MPDLMPIPNSDFTLGTFRDFMTDWLNRTDISTQQANMIIKRGLARCQRDLRLAQMERDLTVQATAGTPIQSIPIPADFLIMRQVEADNTSCQPVSYAHLLRLPKQPGRGAVFARNEGDILFRPYPQSYARLVYYAKFQPLNADTDSNELLALSPECLLFACLSYAANFFAMDQEANFEQRYQQEVTTLNNVNQEMDTLGGPTAVQPATGYFWA